MPHSGVVVKYSILFVVLHLTQLFIPVSLILHDPRRETTRDPIDIVIAVNGVPASCILIIIRHVICQVKWKSADAGPNRRGNRKVPRPHVGSHAETMIKIVNICGRPPVLRPLRAFGTLPPHPIY